MTPTAILSASSKASRISSDCPILAIVVPCYNEQECIPETSRRLAELLQSLNQPVGWKNPQISGLCVGQVHEVKIISFPAGMVWVGCHPFVFVNQ